MSYGTLIKGGQMKEIVEIIASITTLMLIFWGIPAQIIGIYRRKNTEGVSFIFFLISFLSWITVGLHHYLAGSIYMALTFGLGGLTTLIILAQFFFYRSNSPYPRPDEKKILQQIIEDDLKRALNGPKETATDDDTDSWKNEGGKIRPDD